MQTSYSFIDSVSYGYRHAWQQRAVLIQIATIALVLKLLSLIGVHAFGLTENVLRQGLIFIPSYFAEGWLLARVVRMAILGEGVHPTLTGHAKQDFKRLREYSSVLLASALVYVLTKLLSAVLMFFLMSQSDIYGATPPVVASAPPDVSTSIIAFSSLIAVVAGFRFFWLYIPVALGIPMRHTLKTLMPMRTSFHMIGIYLICFLPIMLVYSIIMSGLSSVLMPLDTPAVLQYIAVVLQVVIELITVIVATLSVAHYFKTLFTGKTE